MRLIFLLFSLLAAPFGGFAQECQGQDLVAALSPAKRAELERAVQAQPYPEGLLWQAKRGDTTFWLFGTFHIYDDEVLQLLGRVRPLIQLADVVYVEGTREDMDKMQSEMLSRPEFMFNYDNPTLPDILSEAEWQILSEAVRARGMPPILASKLAPWLVSVTISLPVCALRAQKAGLEGLDVHIMDYAKSSGKPLKALEPYDTLFSVFSEVSFEDQVKMVQSALPGLAIGEDGFATMRQQYLDGRVLEIWEFSRMLGYQYSGLAPAEVDQMMGVSEAALIRRRNLDWLDRVLPDTEGKSAFIAAGALHLAGNNGLLNMLDQRGFDHMRLDGGLKPRED